MSIKASSFLEKPPAWQHKKGCEALERRDFDTYREIEAILALEPVGTSHEDLSNRYHYHLKQAGLSRKEHNLFYITSEDTPSDVPFLPYAIYLDNLRSGYNVGNIVRTVEALRAGSIYFSKNTPFIDNKKVKDAAMGTEAHVPCYECHSLSDLPRPFIAIETAADAIPVQDFSFPESGTLFLGNEEYGLSKEVLQQADYLISIPLVGMKNSLNVANAFAIIASHLR